MIVWNTSSSYYAFTIILHASSSGRKESVIDTPSRPVVARQFIVGVLHATKLVLEEDRLPTELAHPAMEHTTLSGDYNGACIDSTGDKNSTATHRIPQSRYDAPQLHLVLRRWVRLQLFESIHSFRLNYSNKTLQLFLALEVEVFFYPILASEAEVFPRPLYSDTSPTLSCSTTDRCFYSQKTTWPPFLQRLSLCVGISSKWH